MNLREEVNLSTKDTTTEFVLSNPHCNLMHTVFVHLVFVLSPTCTRDFALVLRLVEDEQHVAGVLFQQDSIYGILPCNEYYIQQPNIPSGMTSDKCLSARLLTPANITFHS